MGCRRRREPAPGGVSGADIPRNFDAVPGGNPRAHQEGGTPVGGIGRPVRLWAVRPPGAPAWLLAPRTPDGHQGTTPGGRQGVSGSTSIWRTSASTMSPSGDEPAPGALTTVCP